MIYNANILEVFIKEYRAGRIDLKREAQIGEMEHEALKHHLNVVQRICNNQATSEDLYTLDNSSTELIGFARMKTIEGFVGYDNIRLITGLNDMYNRLN